MAQLQEIWPYIKELLNIGVSLVPIRDKEEVYKGKTYLPKTPVVQDWKQWTMRVPTEAEIFRHMDTAGTTAIALIGGKVSGNLEIIDIDVKHWEGLGAQLLKDMHDIYPEIFKLLRIHQTPSGGYHVLYRVGDGVIPGNKKLAYHATEKQAGIETRGEGGYAAVPPSLGYRVVKDCPIPTITWAEREALIALCMAYNQKPKKDKYIVKEQRRDDYYEENPFTDFNNSTAAETVLQDAGWKFHSRSANFIQWTRPGKSHGVSATFNLNNRLYYYFTTSTDAEAGRCYTPATVMAMELFNGDRKRLYDHLVKSGYGKVRRDIEERVAKRSALKGSNLPANFSKEIQEKHVAMIQEAHEKYPYGIFWLEEDEKIKISHERILQVAEGLGYRLYMESIICRIIGHRIIKTTDRRFLDDIKAYVQELDMDYHLKILDAYERFMQQSFKYISSRLPILLDDEIVSSSKNISYKFYQNGYLEISADSMAIQDYDTIPGYVWEEAIQPRNFSFMPAEQYIQCCYFDYLEKAIGVTDHLFQCLGYLAHEYKDTESAYIIVLTEQCEDPLEGGGSGKNVFCSVLSGTTTIHNIPGSQVQYGDNFLQTWNFQRILSIADIPENFDFNFLKPISDAEGQLNKKYVNRAVIPPHLMPKLMLSTNYSYRAADGGLKRRIIPIEFTDFFTKCGGVNTKYGKMFPTSRHARGDWDAYDWACFDNIIACCIQAFLQAGKLRNPGLTTGGWKKQFETEHGHATYQFISEHIEGWILSKFVDNTTFINQYNRFLLENDIDRKYRKSSHKINAAIRQFCDNRKIKVVFDIQKKTVFGNSKGKTFELVA